MSNYFFGNTQEQVLGNAPKFFYGLRRTAEGSLYFARINQLSNESLTINNPGDPLENFDEFEVGIDFYEGRNANHEIVFENLKYEQYRWDNRSLFYYVNENGELVVRINQSYTYPTGI
jgi:hypothetical protein